MVELWEKHTLYEFGLRDADLAVSTMVADASVMHLPTMSGGFGRDNLRSYYRDVFIPAIPADTTSEVVARSIGDDFLVEEAIMRLTHSCEIPFLAPRVAPTGAVLEVPFVVIVTFHDGLMRSERLYWDQAAVLRQLRLIRQDGLPLAELSGITTFLRQKVAKQQTV
jgi:carboxymethylenebutenolidase